MINTDLKILLNHIKSASSAFHPVFAYFYSLNLKVKKFLLFLNLLSGSSISYCQQGTFKIAKPQQTMVSPSLLYGTWVDTADVGHTLIFTNTPSPNPNLKLFYEKGILKKNANPANIDSARDSLKGAYDIEIRKFPYFSDADTIGTFLVVVFKPLNNRFLVGRNRILILDQLNLKIATVSSEHPILFRKVD
jgi:hypothetical protein